MNRSLATSLPRTARARAVDAATLQQHGAWRPALMLGLVSLLLLGLAHALAATGASRLLFPAQADGSLLIRDGQVRGSQLIAQPFTGDGYFQARPSAANYDRWPRPAATWRAATRPCRNACRPASPQWPRAKG